MLKRVELGNLTDTRYFPVLDFERTVNEIDALGFREGARRKLMRDNVLGIETMLSRDTDVYVPLEERTARANAFQSDLFISIHADSIRSGRARGEFTHLEL